MGRFDSDWICDFVDSYLGDFFQRNVTRKNQSIFALRGSLDLLDQCQRRCLEDLLWITKKG